MKVLVCGSREWSDGQVVNDTLDTFDAFEKITHVIHGGARGADSMGGAWAVLHGASQRVFQPRWAIHGKGAGFIRNQRMVDWMIEEDEKGTEIRVVAFWKDQSRGTAHTIRIAQEAFGPERVIVIEG